MNLSKSRLWMFLHCGSFKIHTVTLYFLEGGPEHYIPEPIP